MKRKLFCILTGLCLLISCIFAVSAESARVVDDAELLTESQVSKLEKKLDKLSNKYKLDIVIVTVESTEGETPMDYADDYYDNNGYADDGILLLISMEDSDWWISTAGDGMDIFTDAGIEYMSDQFVPMMSEEDFAGAFTCFAELCEEFVLHAETGDPYDSHNLPKEPFSVGFNLVVSLVIGLIVAFIATAIMKGQLKSVHQKPHADDYMTPGSLHLTNSRDIFLYSHISRREKPQNSSGSSTHRSSSGRSHGGGGGKF